MTLQLTLKKQWFKLMITGEKAVEYRKPSDWIKARLLGKEYEVVKFVNGYGSDKPYFVCDYLGYKMAKSDGAAEYGDYIIEYEKGGLPNTVG